MIYSGYPPACRLYSRRNALASPEKITAFDRELEQAYREILPEEHSVLVKMKRIYACRLDAAGIRGEKRIRIMSAEYLGEFHRAAEETFNSR